MNWKRENQRDKILLREQPNARMESSDVVGMGRAYFRWVVREGFNEVVSFELRSDAQGADL